MFRIKEGVLFFDLDDVVFDMKSASLDFNNKFFGVILPPEEYSGNWMSTRWGAQFASQEEFKKVIDGEWFVQATKAGLYENIKVMPEARKVLMGLYYDGVPLGTATSRPATLLKEATLYSLGRELPDIEFVKNIFMGDLGWGMTKGEAVKRSNGLMLVDDFVTQCEAAIVADVRGLVFGDNIDVRHVVADESRGLYRAKDWLEADVVIRRIFGFAA